MHPALSVIFFSVTAGSGYGLLILLVLARYTGTVQDFSADQVLQGAFLGLLLVTLGLVSSTFHLANPKNAWRSFTRFKTSWLSREAVFAVLFYPLSLLWIFSEWSSGPSIVSIVLGSLVLILALVVLVCTAMIYASLKTIRQWHNPITPINFVLLGLMLGGLILLFFIAMKELDAGYIPGVCLLLVIASALAKAVYYLKIGKPDGPTINSALGFKKATVRLLDVGHTSGTFLTDEFGFELARTKLIWLRVLVFVCAFGLPLLLLSGLVGRIGVNVTLLAAVIAWLGVFTERWLFFAEARHVVNLYHGAQRT